MHLVGSLHLGMFVLEEASCCVLVNVTSGCELYGTPTGGGEKGSDFCSDITIDFSNEGCSDVA